jgi:polyphosphate kinase
VVIKLTLYRAGSQSNILDALLCAASRGVDASVFVELKARFDEEINVEWAKRLEDGAIHVVHGLVGLKTHAKMALVVRRENGKLKRYAHIGSGNYNSITARVYTDVGLLTTDPELTADVQDLFNELTGSSAAPNRNYRALLVAPTHMLRGLLVRIEREAEHASMGRGGRIRAKLNGLADRKIIEALYRASQAGVEIDLVVRGICLLRPGVRGLSERIRVISVLGRFLEHARIFSFANRGDAEYFISSADWRARNLRRRVEVAAPVRDPACRAQLDAILDLELADPAAWELQADGSSVRRSRDSSTAVQSVQEMLIAGEQATTSPHPDS